MSVCAPIPRPKTAAAPKPRLGAPKAGPALTAKVTPPPAGAAKPGRPAPLKKSC